MGIENYLVTATCLGFVAQRLLRVLCPSCKKKKSISVANLKNLVTSLKGKKQPVHTLFTEPKGCKDCMDIGYRGRIGIYELLVLDNELRDFVIQNQSLDALRKLAKKKGMRTLREAAIQKLLDGVSSMEEVMRVT